MTDHDVDYYAKRARQEREHAQRSEDVTARRIHLEMAERYQAKLNAVPLRGPIATV